MLAQIGCDMRRNEKKLLSVLGKPRHVLKRPIHRHVENFRLFVRRNPFGFLGMHKLRPRPVLGLNPLGIEPAPASFDCDLDCLGKRESCFCSLSLKALERCCRECGALRSSMC